MTKPIADGAKTGFATLRGKHVDVSTILFSGLTGFATFLIIAILFVILGNVIWNGRTVFSWHFISTGTHGGMFDMKTSGVLPMIIGTAARVILMTIFVVPIGILTAIYLTEYAQNNSPFTRLIRMAINNLAGVPSVVFGLFGLGFFIEFVGKNMDSILHPHSAEVIWGQRAIIWASLTLAVMTLPVLIVATEESLRAIPQGLREASLALGGTKLETIIKIVLPQAMPGILTGTILAVSRASGEVAPLLFTGAAYYLADPPKALTDQFMDLGYHTFILATQSPNVEEAKPIIYATVLTLLILTFTLNIVAIIIRSRMRAHLRALN